MKATTCYKFCPKSSALLNHDRPEATVFRGKQMSCWLAINGSLGFYEAVVLWPRILLVRRDSASNEPRERSRSVMAGSHVMLQSKVLSIRTVALWWRLTKEDDIWFDKAFAIFTSADCTIINSFTYCGLWHLLMAVYAMSVIKIACKTWLTSGFSSLPSREAMPYIFRKLWRPA